LWRVTFEQDQHRDDKEPVGRAILQQLLSRFAVVAIQMLRANWVGQRLVWIGAQVNAFPNMQFALWLITVTGPRLARRIAAFARVAPTTLYNT
jgi:hypothetical protein